MNAHPSQRHEQQQRSPTENSFAASDARRMAAVRLRSPGTAGLALEKLEIPAAGRAEALVRVRAVAITRDELEWPLDRLPAIPSYELSGTVVELGAGASDLTVGEAVYALTDFDRDGVAAEYAVVPARLLARKPRRLGHVESAAIPLAGLSAWQGLFEHGGLREGERVLVTGATGGVGQFATQLAHWRGSHVIGTASAEAAERARALGADATVDPARIEELSEPVDLVFDTVGGDVLARSPTVLREGGRLVTIAEEPPASVTAEVDASYFVVEPNREQLVELARLVDEGAVRPLIDSVYPLHEIRQAFERVEQRGKSGKVVLEISR